MGGLNAISEAIKIVGDPLSDKTRDKYGKYSSLYSFTTENLGGSYSKFDFNGKETLTVCGSGDQAFNAILMGATKADVFDINFLSYMFLKLKEAAIKALSYEEFFKYFYLKKVYDVDGVKYREAMNETSYKKIREYLSGYYKEFWDALYGKFRGHCIRRSYLFFNDIGTEKEVILSNPYLEKKNFEILKKRIGSVEINFINTNVMEITQKLIKSYDFIDFSNIPAYLSNLEKYRDVIFELFKYLNYGGSIIPAYLYDFPADCDEMFLKEIYRPSLLKKLFPDF